MDTFETFVISKQAADKIKQLLKELPKGKREPGNSEIQIHDFPVFPD